MQAIWSDYGDIKAPLYTEEDEDYDWVHPENNWRLLRQLHAGQAGPGAWLGNWRDVPSYDDDPSIDMSYQNVNRLSVETFQYDRVRWEDSMYDSPYRPWDLPDPPPATWPFYKIPPRCHAYVQISDGTSDLWDFYKNTTMWRVDKPMFVEHSAFLDNTAEQGKRYPSNNVFIMLEIGWTRFGKAQNGETAGRVDWRYESLHFLTPPPDIHPAYDANYDLLAYGQSLSTLCPVIAPSHDHFIQWVNIHIYNTGMLTMYCPGISVYTSS